jgi:multiple sugar transport system substrate-binding protein
MAICILPALFGCSGASRSREVVLHLSNWGGASDDPAFSRNIDRLYREFERENPNIKLEIESVPDEYVQKMVLSFVADSAPDVLSLDASSAAVFINNGVLKDLSPMAAADPRFRQSDFWPNVFGIDKRGKSLYAVPGDFSPIVVYYNKKLFDAAHVPYPHGRWSFKQFLKTAQRLTLRDVRGNVTQYGFNFANWMPGWIVWLWNAGGDVLSADGSMAHGTLDSDQNVETVSFLRDLVTRFKVSPNISQTEATGVDPFGNGTTAMEISGHWELPGFKTAPRLRLSDVGVTELPTQLPSMKTVMYEVGFAMPQKAKHPKESWSLIKYLSSHLYQQAYQQTGIAICARQDVATERAADPRERSFLSIVPSARGPWGAKVVGYEFVEQEGKKMMERVLSGVDPRQALRQMADRIDSYFKVR